MNKFEMPKSNDRRFIHFHKKKVHVHKPNTKLMKIAPDTMRKIKFIDIICIISSPNPMFGHLLEYS